MPMIKNIFLTILSLFFLALGADGAHAQMQHIVMVVNDDAITQRDVTDRLDMVVSSSGLPNNAQTREKILPQVIDALVEEQLKIQEAQHEEIDITDEEVQSGFAQIAQNNKTSPDEFRAMISRMGINPQTMERQIRSQIGWSKLVQAKLRPRVKISENDIDAARQRLMDAAGKPEYLVAEIFLPVASAAQESDMRQLAGRLLEQINTGQAPFFKLAQQFSKAAGAAQGGDMGWVRAGSLDPDLDQALAQLQPGSISGAVRTDAGYHILLLREKRVTNDETLPSEAQIRYDLGIERLQRLERRYLMDLRAAAFIEQRG